jgi:hypothetical protein
MCNTVCNSNRNSTSNSSSNTARTNSPCRSLPFARSLQLDETLSDIKKTKECLTLQLRSGHDPKLEKRFLAQMEAVEMETPPRHKAARRTGTPSLNKKSQQVTPPSCLLSTSTHYACSP